MARTAAAWKFRVEDRHTGRVVSRHKSGFCALDAIRRAHSLWLRRVGEPPDFNALGEPVLPNRPRDPDAQTPFRLIEVATGKVPASPAALRDRV